MNTLSKELTSEQIEALQIQIFKYFNKNTHEFLAEHGNPAQYFKPISFNQIDSLLGLAYTSGSSCAALWCCNAGYLKHNKTHNFIGFSITTEGKFVGIAWDNDENELIVELSTENTIQASENMTELQKSISKCTYSGNTVYLPPVSSGPIENYKEVKQAFMNAGAKYSKNTFVFPNEAAPYIERLMGGESVNIKKEFQFFATPAKLAQHMVELAEVDNYQRILEPSAGQGAIIKAIRNKCSVNVDCLELMDVNIQVLSKLEGCTLVGEDFLNASGLGDYDRVIANPPFSKNQDIDHIKQMFKVCKSGGRIVTMASTSWKNGSQKKQIEFRSWLEDLDAEIEDIEAGAFKESGTNVPTCLIIINKP